MEVIIRRDAAAASDLVARIVAADIRANPSIALGLATGRTMDMVYERLRGMKLDFSKCRTFNLDEYVGLPSSDPRSYRAYMNKALFHHVNVALANTHVPNGLAADLDAECCQYEEQIKACGGVDLQL